MSAPESPTPAHPHNKRAYGGCLVMLAIALIIGALLYGILSNLLGVYHGEGELKPLSLPPHTTSPEQTGATHE